LIAKLHNQFSPASHLQNHCIALYNILKIFLSGLMWTQQVLSLTIHKFGDAIKTPKQASSTCSPEHFKTSCPQANALRPPRTNLLQQIQCSFIHQAIILITKVVVILKSNFSQFSKVCCENFSCYCYLCCLCCNGRAHAPSNNARRDGAPLALCPKAFLPVQPLHWTYVFDVIIVVSQHFSLDSSRLASRCGLEILYLFSWPSQVSAPSHAATPRYVCFTLFKSPLRHRGFITQFSI
jgi:hypothetical protein